MNEELYRVCRESTPAQWSQRGLNPRPLGFKSRCLREKNKSLPSRTCRTQAKYYLRHCKQYCTQGRHNFLGRFICRWFSSVSSQSNSMKVQNGIKISLRYHVNRPLGITKLTRTLPILVHSTWFEYRHNYSNYSSVKGLLAKSNEDYGLVAIGYKPSRKA